MKHIYTVNNAKIYADKNTDTGYVDIYCELFQYNEDGTGIRDRIKTKIGEFKRSNYNVSIMEDLTEYGLISMFYNRLKEINFPCTD